MNKLIKKILWILLTLSTLTLSLFIFFIFTTTGFKTLVRLSTFYFKQPLTVQGLKGSLYNQPQIAELNYQYSTLEVTMNNVRIDWNLFSLIHQKLPIHQLNAESIKIKQNNTLITLNDIKLNALLTKHEVVLNSLSFNYLNLKILGQLTVSTHYPYTIKSTIKCIPLVDKSKSLSGRINAAGDIHLINWTGDFQGPGIFSLQGTLSQLKHLEQTIKWRDLNLQNIARPGLLSKKGKITAKGLLPHINIQISSKINSATHDQWQINGELQGVFPWTWNFNFNALQAAPRTHEGIYTNLALKGMLQGPSQGSVTVKISPGHYQIQTKNGFSSLPFQGGTLTANLLSYGLKGLGTLVLDEHKKLNIKFSLPKFNLSQGVTAQQTISSELFLEVNSFDFLTKLIPSIKNPKGVLKLSLFANGPLTRPNIETKLALNNASIELPDLGLNLNAIDYSIVGKKDHWEGIGAIKSANKQLKLKGQGLLKEPWSIDLAVEGSDFPVINTQEFQISTSPKLQLKYNQDTFSIIGSVLVPHALVKIQSFSNSISLSNDVVFKSKEKKHSNPLGMQIDVQVEAGNQVELNAKGLHATLSGTVHIQQSPQSAMNATGELNVIQGNYKAYGQNLSIEQGELFFTGGTIENPGINLRASKTINTSSIDANNTNQLLDFNNNNLQNTNLRGNITVGIEVTGRLTDPDIRLYSTPAILSQADILSMLVLGRPASQANKAGGQLLLAAISSMNLGKGTEGTQLLEQLKQNLGVDFSVETNSNYNLLTNTVSDKTAFVVSKSLSKRVSLGYNVGLSQSDPNVVTLKYLLNKFFSIQINSSGTSSGLDVLYTSNAG